MKHRNPKFASQVPAVILACAFVVMVLPTYVAVGAHLRDNSKGKPVSLSQLDMVSPVFGWATSPLGVLRTTDGAHTWTLHDPPGVTPKSLAACPDNRGSTVEGISPKRAWFVFSCEKYAVTVSRTSTGGSSWKSVIIDLKDRVASFNYPSLDFVHRTRGWLALMGFGIGPPSVSGLFRTNNGGKRWSQLRPKLRITSLLGFQTRSRGFAAAESHQIDAVDFSHFPYVTDNGGKTWMHRKVPIPKGYRKAIVEPYAVAFSGTSSATLPVNLYNTSKGTYLFTTYRTHDGGDHWTHTALLGGHSDNDFSSSFFNAKDGWASHPAGGQNVLYRTIDGGRHWRLMGAGYRGFIYVTRSVGFALGYDSSGKRYGVLETKNGGRTWSFIEPHLH